MTREGKGSLRKPLPPLLLTESHLISPTETERARGRAGAYTQGTSVGRLGQARRAEQRPDKDRFRRASEISASTVGAGTVARASGCRGDARPIRSAHPLAKSPDWGGGRDVFHCWGGGARVLVWPPPSPPSSPARGTTACLVDVALRKPCCCCCVSEEVTRPGQASRCNDRQKSNCQC